MESSGFAMRRGSERSPSIRLRPRIGVAGGQVIEDVIAHAVFERGEGFVETGLSKSLHLRLGEVLVFASNLLGHGDVLDVRFASKRVKDRSRKVRETPRMARANIEEARDSE